MTLISHHISHHLYYSLHSHTVIFLRDFYGIKWFWCPEMSWTINSHVFSAVTTTAAVTESSSSCDVETKDCDYDVTSELVAASSTSSPSNADADSYRREVQLQVEHVPVDGRQPMYRLFNTSRAAAPFLSFEVPRGASVLRAVYDATTVRDDGTLTAELTRRTTSSGTSSWMLTVTGQLQRCPGTH